MWKVPFITIRPPRIFPVSGWCVCCLFEVWLPQIEHSPLALHWKLPVGRSDASSMCLWHLPWTDRFYGRLHLAKGRVFLIAGGCWEFHGKSLGWSCDVRYSQQMLIFVLAMVWEVSREGQKLPAIAEYCLLRWSWKLLGWCCNVSAVAESDSCDDLGGDTGRSGTASKHWILSRTLIIFIFPPILFEIQTVVMSTSVVIKHQVLYLNSNYWMLDEINPTIWCKFHNILSILEMLQSSHKILQDIKIYKHYNKFQHV